MSRHNLLRFLVPTPQLSVGNPLRIAGVLFGPTDVLIRRHVGRPVLDSDARVWPPSAAVVMLDEKQGKGRNMLEVAKRRADEVADSLFCYLEVSDRTYFLEDVTLKGTALQGEDKGLTVQSMPAGYAPHICSKDTRHLRSSGFSRVEVALRKSPEQRSQMEKALTLAAQWWRRSAVELDDAVALVGFATTMETLVMDTPDRSARTVGLRIAALLEKPGADREKTYHQAQRVYNARNQALHEGKIDWPTGPDSRRVHARQLALRAIHATWKRLANGRFEKKKDLIALLERDVLRGIGEGTSNGIER